MRFPELAESLRISSPRIEHRFVEEVRSIIPELDQLTFKDLLDNLAGTLDSLADVLQGDVKSVVEHLLSDVSEHAETRFHQEFSIAQFMTEHAILRRIILEELRGVLGRDLTHLEGIGVNLAHDLLVRRAVNKFVAFQRQQIVSYTEAQAKQLSFLSHDLRGSLNGILLMLEVLRRDLVKHPDLQESLEDLEMMRRSILETVTTMDRFLYAERFRRGKVVLKPMKFDLSQVVNEVITQFSYQAKDKDLELKSELGENNWPIISDRALISIILQNLIGNGIKYTRSGSVRVLASKLPNGNTRLTVADSGVGIDKDKIQKMFAEFTRGENHGTAGTGLGLSIAVQAADLLQAKLWAESEVGKGSRFHLDLHDLSLPQPK